MLQGTPWTIHLQGLERLLDARAHSSPSPVPSPEFIQAIEIMAAMDIDAFVIGRKSPGLKLWRRYRGGDLFPLRDEADSIEVGCGVPKSLLDLIDFKAPDVYAEQALYLWPGFEGTFLQCHLWDAYRFAAMLDVRQKRRLTGASGQLGSSNSPEESSISLPSDVIVLTRGLSAIDAIYNGAVEHQAADSALMNALLYPLYILTMQVVLSRQHENWYHLLEHWFHTEIERDRCANTQLAWEVIQDVLKQQKQGRSGTPDELASVIGNEVSLL